MEDTSAVQCSDSQSIRDRSLNISPPEHIVRSIIDAQMTFPSVAAEAIFRGRLLCFKEPRLWERGQRRTLHVGKRPEEPEIEETHVSWLPINPFVSEMEKHHLKVVD